MMALLCAMLMTAVCVVRCGGDPRSADGRSGKAGQAGRLDGVTRVFSHRINAFSVWAPVPEGGQKPQWLECHTFYRECVTAHSDVPTDRPMWVEYEFAPGYGGNFSKLDKLTLHLHSIKDISAAGWQYRVEDGQTVDGTSVVIE